MWISCYNPMFQRDPNQQKQHCNYHEIPRQQTHLEICLENYQLENEECFLQKFSNYSLFSVFYRLKLKILKVATLSSVVLTPAQRPLANSQSGTEHNCVSNISLTWHKSRAVVH